MPLDEVLVEGVGLLEDGLIQLWFVRRWARRG